MLRLSVMGHSKLLHPFINHFKSQPFYEIKSECSQAVVEATVVWRRSVRFLNLKTHWINLLTAILLG